MQNLSYSEARDNLKAAMDKAVANRASILICNMATAPASRQRGDSR